MNHHIEVIVTKLRTRYRAECPMFPQCKGVGVSEEKALLQLSHSISKLIAKLTEKNLETLLTSSQYTEVILDARKSKTQQHRVFPLSPDLARATASNFVLKYKSDPAHPQLTPTPMSDLKKSEDIGELLSSLEEILVGNDIGMQTLDEISHTFQEQTDNPLQEEGLIFGFPLSMN